MALGDGSVMAKLIAVLGGSQTKKSLTEQRKPGSSGRFSITSFSRSSDRSSSQREDHDLRRVLG